MVELLEFSIGSQISATAPPVDPFSRRCPADWISCRSGLCTLGFFFFTALKLWEEAIRQLGP